MFACAPTIGAVRGGGVKNCAPPLESEHENRSQKIDQNALPPECRFFLAICNGPCGKLRQSPASPSSRFITIGVIQNMRAAQPIATFSGSSVSAQSDWFSRLAVETAILSGKPITFLGAVAIVAMWAITGPLFHFSYTWPLVINTGTTIITF
jgi:hypothetical protein